MARSKTLQVFAFRPGKPEHKKFEIENMLGPGAELNATAPSLKVLKIQRGGRKGNNRMRVGKMQQMCAWVLRGPDPAANASPLRYQYHNAGLRNSCRKLTVFPRSSGGQIAP